VLRARFEAYRTAESGLAAQQADSEFHLAIMDGAHNDVLKPILLDLKATVSIGAPAHVWGEPSTMRSMELRALHEHEQLVQAIADGRGDDADELARHHGVIDFELITRAMRRAGVLTD
jgi:GntR family transcriptional regulator, transcriptional repressor for pyruvate dehydrogenase complex